MSDNYSCTCLLLAAVEHNSPGYLHLLIEAMQLSFADTWWYCTDPSKERVPIAGLLSEEYAADRRKLIDYNRWINLLTLL